MQSACEGWNRNSISMTRTEQGTILKEVSTTFIKIVFNIFKENEMQRLSK